MLKRHVSASPPEVLLIDEDDVRINVTLRGERSLGQPCQLTIAIEGEEPMSFLEEAGTEAPRAAIINLAAPRAYSAALKNALRTQPWLHADVPIMSYGQIDRDDAKDESPRTVGYLVRNQTVTDVIDTIRETLDLNQRPN